MTYLKGNLVTVARQIDYIFRQLCGKVILGGMHPIGQILNYNKWRESQNRKTKHVHAPVYAIGAPRLDEDDEAEDDDMVSLQASIYHVQ